MRDVQCKHCIEYKGNWCDKKRDDPDPDMVRDCQWFRTKTNADRIRAMSNEEMARFMTSIQADVLEKVSKAVGYPGTLVKDSDIADSEVRWRNWLKQEVSDNG